MLAHKAIRLNGAGEPEWWSIYDRAKKMWATWSAVDGWHWTPDAGRAFVWRVWGDAMRQDSLLCPRPEESYPSAHCDTGLYFQNGVLVGAAHHSATKMAGKSDGA